MNTRWWGCYWFGDEVRFCPCHEQGWESHMYSLDNLLVRRSFKAKDTIRFLTTPEEEQHLLDLIPERR